MKNLNLFKSSVSFCFLFFILISVTYLEATKVNNNFFFKEIKQIETIFYFFQKKTPVLFPRKDVKERRLITTSKLIYTSITTNYEKYSHVKRTNKKFEGTTLAYVTPWYFLLYLIDLQKSCIVRNNHGYDIAKIFNKKLDYVSPTWFTINIDQTNRISIKGQHDVDKNWMNDVRTSNGNTEIFPKIVPRFLFEGWRHGERNSFIHFSISSYITFY